MTDLEQLYQDLIVDHFRNPRGRGELPCPNAKCSLLNPLCGDEVSLQLLVEGGLVKQLRFTGKGCAISQASVSMMSELCEGRTIDEAREAVRRFQQMLKAELPEEELVKLGDAASLKGVTRFAARIRCAMLGWEALSKCLDQAETEQLETPA